MAQARLIAFGAVGVVIVVLASLRTAWTPVFHLDAQYYVQSAVLWPRGEVTFAASLIGSRDLVVLLWYLAFETFGRTLEALSIALALLYAATCSALSIAIFRLIERPVCAAVASIITAIAAFPLAIWSSPASDAPAAAALASLWAVSVFALRPAADQVAPSVFGFLGGLFVRLRPELLLFVVFAASAFAVFRATRARAMVRIGSVFFLLLAGVMVGSRLWSLWVPVERPETFRLIFPVYRAFDDMAIGANGPASKRIAQELRVGPDEDLSFWNAIGQGFAKDGVRATDILVARAGWEAVQRDPATFATSVLRDFCAELCKQSESLLPRLRLERVDRVTERRETAASLQRLDGIRERASEAFGDDATWPTATLADVRDNAVVTDSVARNLRANWTLPRSLPLIGCALLLVFAVVTRRSIGPALYAPALYGPAVALFVAASQGPITRYIEAAVLLQFAALAAASASLISKSDRIRNSNRCVSVAAVGRRSKPAGSAESGLSGRR